MTDNKKSSLLQAVNKIKGAKKNTQGDAATKSAKNNSAGNAIAGKIKDAVSKVDRD